MLNVFCYLIQVLGHSMYNYQRQQIFRKVSIIINYKILKSVATSSLLIQWTLNAYLLDSFSLLSIVDVVSCIAAQGHSDIRVTRHNQNITITHQFNASSVYMDISIIIKALAVIHTTVQLQHGTPCRLIPQETLMQ